MRPLPYLKVIAPRFTRAVFPILLYQSSGRSRFLIFCNARTLSSQPIAYTWKLLSRSSSRRWSRLSHLPRNGLPSCWSASKNAGKPISASSLCSKYISPGHLWYAISTIRKKNCDDDVEGLSGSRSIMRTMLKRDAAVLEFRCCVYFAARKRESLSLRTADVSHRPRAGPKIGQCSVDQAVNLIMRTIARTYFDQLLTNDVWGIGKSRGVEVFRHHTSASTTHDSLRSMRLRRMTHSSQLRLGKFPKKSNVPWRHFPRKWEGVL